MDAIDIRIQDQENWEAERYEALIDQHTEKWGVKQPHVTLNKTAFGNPAIKYVARMYDSRGGSKATYGPTVEGARKTFHEMELHRCV